MVRFTFSRGTMLRFAFHPALLIMALFVFLSWPGGVVCGPKDSGPFSDAEITLLIKTLQGKKQDARTLRAMLKKPGVIKLPDTVAMNITNPIQLNSKRYAGFYNPWSLSLARGFMRRWKSTLTRAEGRYGVDREVIVAILLVETGFGRTTGTWPVFSVYASVFVDADRYLREENFERDGRLHKRFKKKRAWALDQLRALMEMAGTHGIDPTRLKGSYAGAFGMAQFLPRSYLNWAVSTRKNQRPDLHYEPDAIYSVANYLKQNGWGKSRLDESSRKAVWHYNNSQVYVNTVMEVAIRLQKRRTADHPAP